MKIAQYSNKNFSVAWFLWNVSTFKALHPEFTHSSTNKGFLEFSDTVGLLKINDVTLVTECRILDLLGGGLIASGFSGCSKEDVFYAPVGMKNSLEKAFKDLKSVTSVSKADIADFYKGLFNEGTFGWRLRDCDAVWPLNVNPAFTEAIIDRFLDVTDVVSLALGIVRDQPSATKDVVTISANKEIRLNAPMVSIGNNLNMGCSSSSNAL